MWKTLSRPLQTAWRGRYVPFRYTYSSLQNPLLQTRPGGLWAKIRFRANGQPRSTWTLLATGAGSVSSGAFALFAAAVYMKDRFDEAYAILNLVATIHAQKQDTKYNSVNFADRAQNMAYFKGLCACCDLVLDGFLSGFASKELDGVLQTLRVDKERDLEAEAHKIMRQAALEVHEAFQKLEPGHGITSAQGLVVTVITAVNSAWINLQKLSDGVGRHPSLGATKLANDNRPHKDHKSPR